MTREEDQQIAFSDMRNAKNDAYFLALSKLGYDVSIDWGPATIEQLSCFAADDAGRCTKRSSGRRRARRPATRSPRSTGSRSTTLPDLSPLINTHQAGDTVTVGFKRDGQGHDR